MKKKICFIVSSSLTVNVFLKNHFEVLSSEFEISLIGNFNNDELNLLRDLNLKNIISIPICRKINIVSDLKAIYLLYTNFKKIKFDAIHSVSPKAGLLSAISGWAAKIKVRTHIFTGQVWASEKGFYRNFLKTFDKIITLFSTNILVDSCSQREFLIKEKIISYENSAVLGMGSISGVDMKRFQPNPVIRKKYRGELKINDSTVVFIFVGRLNRDKGILDLARAFKILLDESRDVFLLMVGPDEENMIENIKSLLGNNDRFHFWGHSSHPEDILPSGDIFCLPSYREGFGTSIIEASSCELPIICSNIYGLEDAIINEQTGLRHQVRNVNDLYKQMLKLTLNEELRHKLGKNGKKYVSSNFSSELVSNAWLIFYREILN